MMAHEICRNHRYGHLLKEKSFLCVRCLIFVEIYVRKIYSKNIYEYVRQLQNTEIIDFNITSIFRMPRELVNYQSSGTRPQGRPTKRWMEHFRTMWQFPQDFMSTYMSTIGRPPLIHDRPRTLNPSLLEENFTSEPGIETIIFWSVGNDVTRELNSLSSYYSRLRNVIAWRAQVFESCAWLEAGGELLLGLLKLMYGMDDVLILMLS